MPPQLLFDIGSVDLNQVLIDIPGIEAVNPHRGDMRMLDGIIYMRDVPSAAEAVAFKDVRPDEFWCAGHIPGRPILPGVLMIEAAAQLASFLVAKLRQSDGRFLGFIGADECKFRGQVTPGQRLILLCKETEFRAGRRFSAVAQGLVNGSLVFEGKISGMPI